MAIVFKPNYDTTINQNVSEQRQIDEGADLPYKRLEKAGQAMTTAGQELYERAKAQAKAAQIRDAVEKYNIAVTETSDKASFQVDNNTGKMGKEPSAPMFSDFMQKEADRWADDVAISSVDPEYREDFRNEIQSSKQSVKLKSILKQSEILSGSSVFRQEKRKEEFKANLANFNAKNESAVNKAVKYSEELEKLAVLEFNSGNITQQQLDEITSKYKEELTDPLVNLIVDKQDDSELFDAIGADLFLSKEVKDLIDENPNSDVARKLMQFRAKAQFEINDNKKAYEFRQKAIKSKITFSDDKRTKMLKSYLDTMMTKANKSREGIPDLLSDVVNTYSDPSSPPSKRAEADVQFNTHMANLTKAGVPIDDKIEATIKYETSKKIGAQLRINPLLSPSQRTAMIERETQSVLQNAKKNPEYAGFLKSAPVFGAKIKAFAIEETEKQNKVLQEKFKKSPSNFVFEYVPSVRTAWEKALSPSASESDIATAKTLTEKEWRKYAEGQGVKDSDIKYDIMPDAISQKYDLEFENALTNGDYKKVLALRQHLDKTQTTSIFTYKATKAKSTHSPLYNATQFMTAEGATEVAASWWKSPEEREARLSGLKNFYKEMGDDGIEKSKEFDKAADAVVSNSLRNLGIPGQETQGLLYAKQWKEVLLSGFTARAARTGDYSKKALIEYANQFVAKSHTPVTTTVNHGYVEKKAIGMTFKVPQGATTFNLNYPVTLVPKDKVNQVTDKFNKYVQDLRTTNYKNIDISGPALTAAFNDLVVQYADSPDAERLKKLSVDDRKKAILDFYFKRGWVKNARNDADGSEELMLLINGKDEVPLRFTNPKHKFYYKDAVK